jgi:hypothetical protein
MIRSYTGPSSLTFQQKRQVALDILRRPIKGGDVWRSGCAYGVDSIVAYLTCVVDVELELFIPAAGHNYTMVEELRPGALQTIYAPQRRNPAESYRIRNQMMVRDSGELMAFVFDEQFYRSGEWMTINIAKKLGVPYWIRVIK